MDAKSQIVWIFGPSGAGKGTIIKHLIVGGKRWKFLFEKLGLSKNVIKSVESFKNEGRSSDKVKEEVINLSKEGGGTILIKVQWEDIEKTCIPKELRQEIPNATHRIIMLYITPAETVKRLKNDHRPNRRVCDEETAKSHLQRMIGYVLDLEKDGFEVTWVNSNNDVYDLLSQNELENLISVGG